MKIIITIVFAFGLCFCSQNSNKISVAQRQQNNLLDSLRSHTTYSEILFHSQTSKMSIVAKEIMGSKGLDSLFSYIGSVSDDIECLTEAPNHFGQISCYADTMRVEPIAELHFLLDGPCEGFYVQTKGRLARYEILPEGKSYLLQLYAKHKASIALR